MGIRGRLLALTLGVAVPLTLIGLAALWGMWTTSRRQLDGMVVQRAELAAVALERFIEAQREPLAVIAASATEPQVRLPAFRENLHFASLRLYLIDLRVLDTQGGTQLSEPADAAPLPVGLVNDLFDEVHRRRSWAVVADLETRGAEQPVLAVGSPVEAGGAVVARIDAAAAGRELFRHIELPAGEVISVFDARGRMLYRSETPQVSVNDFTSGRALLASLNNRNTAVVEAVSPYDGVRRVYGLARIGRTDGAVAVSVPSERLYAPTRRQFARYVVFSLLALLCAVVAALVSAQSIARPLRRLSAATRAFGEGDTSARTQVRAGGGEIAELGNAFNRMAAQTEEREGRLTELDRLKSEFISGVSHELRTPLTTIKTLTRVMLRGGQTEAERRRYLETIADECDRQINLVANLLDLSKIEAGTFGVTAEAVNVAEVARACLMSGRRAAEARGQELRFRPPAELPPVRADYTALRRVLCELVDSAIKYTPDKGRITLSARAEGDEVVISVSDTGPGIEAEDVPHVFEKFYRGQQAAIPDGPDGDSPSESPSDDPPPYMEVPGVGLGMYLARSIVELMNGSISVESEVGRGSTFTVRLPVWEEK